MYHEYMSKKNDHLPHMSHVFMHWHKHNMVLFVESLLLLLIYMSPTFNLHCSLKILIVTVTLPYNSFAHVCRLSLLPLMQVKHNKCAVTSGQCEWACFEVFVQEVDGDDPNRDFAQGNVWTRNRERLTEGCQKGKRFSVAREVKEGVVIGEGGIGSEEKWDRGKRRVRCLCVDGICRPLVSAALHWPARSPPVLRKYHQGNLVLLSLCVFFSSPGLFLNSI